ncbi:hypothetical protein JXL19_03495 [bacterium]|nr:hypothetical protein [bacterium]
MKIRECRKGKIGTILYMLVGFFVICGMVYSVPANAQVMRIIAGETLGQEYQAKKGELFEVPVRINPGITSIVDYAYDLNVYYDNTVLECTGFRYNGVLRDTGTTQFSDSNITIAWNPWDTGVNAFHMGACSLYANSIAAGDLFRIQFKVLSEDSTDIRPFINDPNDPSNALFKDYAFSRCTFVNLAQETVVIPGGIASLDPNTSFDPETFDPNAVLPQGVIELTLGEDPNNSDVDAAIGANVDIYAFFGKTGNNAAGYKDSTGRPLGPNTRLTATLQCFTGSDYVDPNGLIDPANSFIVNLRFTDPAGVEYEYNDPNGGTIYLEVPLHLNLQLYPPTTDPASIRDNVLIDASDEKDDVGRYAIYFIGINGNFDPNDPFIPNSNGRKGESLNVAWRGTPTDGIWIAKIETTHASVWFNAVGPEGLPETQTTPVKEDQGLCFIGAVDR